jgi:UrcA family protein
MSVKTLQRSGMSGALLIVAALGLSLPAISVAEEANQKVQVGDLNLANKKDQQKLERRTLAAINAVCPPRGSAAYGRPSASYVAYRACAQAAQDSVQRQLNDGSQVVARTAK